MKIGIVTEYYYPHLGGITEHVYYSAREFARRGLEPVILTGFSGETDVRVPEGVRIIRLGKSVPIFSNGSYAKVTIGWNLGRKIRKVLEQERFDLLHIHSPSVMVLPCLFSKYANTVTVGTSHTYFDSVIYYELFRKQSQAHFDKLDGLIAVSPSCLEALEKYFHLAEPVVIPNGVDIDVFAKSHKRIEKYNDGVSNILFLGRMDPRNGLDLLIEAFRHVQESLPRTRLLIVGDGEMRHFYEDMAGPMLHKTVFFEGAIDDTRPEYFATSHVFCYPATKASFGITLLEAMAAGLPVVASDNRGFRDVIRNEVNGLLAKQGDTFSLALALTRILQDHQLASTLKKNGLETARSYSWSSVSERILAFYNQIYMKKRGIPFAA